jgi:EAL domain-containing protein (putative c-di-GMP-specific phosphodiesterase class I)
MTIGGRARIFQNAWIESHAVEEDPIVEWKADPIAAPVGRLLVVDDEELVRRGLARVLTRAGHQVHLADSAEAALDALAVQPYDVVVTDLQMPRGDGLSLVRALRERDAGLPAVLLTGQPSVESAAKALESGAFRYLLKPVASEELLRTVQEALVVRSSVEGQEPDRRALRASFERALDGLAMAFQPIVSTTTRSAAGYEALLRSTEPTLRSPIAVIEAAEALGELPRLGRAVRQRVARAMEHAPPDATIFVNLHPADLEDPELFEPDAPLARHAPRVVLELTERATIGASSALDARLIELRTLGYRLAVDDLGSGYAGLSCFASIRPDVVKIDMSLVRGIDGDPVRRRIVQTLVALAASMGVEVVGEGVETAAERDTLVALSCTYLQGYLFARPAPPFVAARWEG